MFRKTKNTTVPLNRDHVGQVFNQTKGVINTAIGGILEEISKLKKPLPEMSLALYGTKEYSLKREYKFLLTVIVLLVVSALEIPLNAAGLEMLGRPQQTTNLMALGLACALGLLAEGTGFAFKRAVVNKSFLGFMGGLFCAAIALTIMYWLSEFRIAYFHRMKFRVEDISLHGQVIFSLAVWFAGVIGVFFLTSGVKNLHMERVFKSKIKSIRNLNKKVQSLNAEKQALKKQHPANLMAAEAYEGLVKHEKTKAENFKLESELQQKQNQKNEVNSRKNAFDSKYSELKVIKEQAAKIAASAEDKNELLANEDYVALISAAETLLEEMTELEPQVPGATGTLEKAKTIVNDIKQLAS